MFGFFRRKKEREAAVQANFENLLGPMSTVVAIAEMLKEHTDNVNSGKIKFPIIEDHNASILKVWSIMRLESFMSFFNHGSANLTLIADKGKQMKLLDVFFATKPHLEFPHIPNGEEVHDTFQALFQTYIYLGEIGTRLCDPLTDQHTLRIKNKNIFDNFESEAKGLERKWIYYLSEDADIETEIPSTIFDILFKDVNYLSKSIALSQKFGPVHEEGIKHLEEVVSNSDESLLDIRKMLESILSAQDPDEVVLH